MLQVKLPWRMHEYESQNIIVHQEELGLSQHTAGISRFSSRENLFFKKDHFAQCHGGQEWYLAGPETLATRSVSRETSHPETAIP